MNYKNFRVPGKDIKVRPHELLVINTPTFQRLFNIKQLGLANLIYPDATHTRASHCLDCMDMAQKMLDALVTNLDLEGQSSEAKKIKGQEDLIRMSALLHDIMHIPYAHTIEDENNVIEKGDKSERIDEMIKIVEQELPKPESSEYGALGVPNKEEYNKVKELLNSVRKVLWTIALHNEENPDNREILKPEDYYISDIIGNTISADLLSYIIKDVDYTGIEKRPGPSYRIFDYFTIAKDEKQRSRLSIKLTKGGLRHDVISAILGILDVRYALTEVVIYHHAKCAASAILGKIAYLCDLQESEKKLYSIGDEELLNILEEKIEKLHGEDKDSAKNLLKNLKSRRLYKRIFKVTMAERESYDRTHTPKLAEKFKSPRERAKIEEEIERELNLPRGSIIIFCPSSQMALKEASAMVIYEKVKESGRGTAKVAVELNGKQFEEDYPEVFKRVKNVQDQYLALWNLYIFLNPEKFLYAAIIQERLEEKLGVKNDAQFQLYLEEKKEYGLSKKIAIETKRQQSKIPAYVFEGINQQLAVRKSPEEIFELDDKAIEDIVKAAFAQHISETGKERSEAFEKPGTLFHDRKSSKKSSE